MHLNKSQTSPLSRPPTLYTIEEYESTIDTKLTEMSTLTEHYQVIAAVPHQKLNTDHDLWLSLKAWSHQINSIYSSAKFMTPLLHASLCNDTPSDRNVHIHQIYCWRFPSRTLYILKLISGMHVLIYCIIDNVVAGSSTNTPPHVDTSHTVHWPTRQCCFKYMLFYNISHLFIHKFILYVFDSYRT